MKKEELIRELAQRTELTKKTVAKVLDEYAKLVLEKVKEEPYVPLPGLGRFEAEKRNQRKGRNPKTGEEIVIPGKIVLVFYPQKSVKVLEELPVE